MTDILLTGGKGALGSAITKKIECYSPDKCKLNVTDIDSIMENITPDVKYVIHCAAITSLEKCDKDRGLAYDVNVTGTRNVINAVKKSNIKLIHISTPCVFDGIDGNYNEKSIPFPETYYGYTKALGEELVMSSGLSYLLIRTNFVPRKPWPYPKAFIDRIGNYLFADEVADEILKLKNQIGLRHVHGNKVMSMFELAQLVTPKVKPMTMKDYKGELRLTKDMTLRSFFD